MSIIQGLIGSIMNSGGGGGGGSSKLITNVWYTTSSGEGYNTDINIDYVNWDGSPIYWTVVGKGWLPANPGVDFTGTLSGISTPVGNGTLTVTTVSFVADQETEGAEGWAVNVGSYYNQNDYWDGTTWTITDISTAPPGKGYGALGGSLKYYTNNGYVSYNDASLAPGTGEFSYEALVRVESRNGYYSGFLVGQGDENDWVPQTGVSFWIENGALNVWVPGSVVGAKAYNISSSLYQDTWMRVSIARCTGGYVRTFINGVNLGETFLANGNVALTQLDIGAHRRLINFDNGYYFYGEMTNIHWNTDPGYVNNKFNTNGNIADERTVQVAATTGTKLLLNTVSDSAKVVDSSSNNFTPSVTGTLGYSQLNSYLVPYLWLDAASSESYPGSGNKWFSLGSGDKHATLYNSPTYGNIGTTPAVPAITFDDRVSPKQYADGGNLGQNSFNTVSVWVYLNGNTWPPATNTNPSFFTEEYPGTTSKIAFNLGTSYSLGNSKIIGETFDTAWYEPSGAALTPSTQTWYMLTYTVGDNGNASTPNGKFYVNGTLQGSEVSLPPQISSGGKYRINRRWDAGEYYDASYAVVQKFNQALSASEVTALYNAQKSRFGY